ncbi:MAG TPA: CsgG/HfaB family protein [Gemmatimonadaceae bacterium]|nr:CsgG/HfaB family protein [Gemmatimonadaceae bacterium]
MRPYASFATILFALSLGACASGASGRSLAHLEQAQRTEPGSFAVNRALGIGYYKAGRYAEARMALETASRVDPKDGTTALYLGLTSEELGDLASAKRAYSTYLSVGRTSSVRRQLQSRLAALTRRELAAEARRSVQHESEIAATAGSPTTIAVLPLRFSGTDSSLRPLERGFAELLITDLARSAQLTVLERAQIQAVLDELLLQSSGATDSGTNVRAGRLLRAGRLVQGSILQLDESQLRVDAAVVDVPTTQVRGVAQGADRMEQLFALEKRLALDLFDQLGVALTVAERNAIEQRPTRSLAAFLAYSRGLTAEDEGRYDDASRFYRDAARIDPGFDAALQRNRDVRSLSAGSRQSAHAIELGLEGTVEAVATGSHGRGRDGAVHAAADDINPSTAGSATAPGRSGEHGPPEKDNVSSATKSDKPGKSNGNPGRVTIVITRPGKP